jgi:mono/diheme cytochrome c family protein
MSEFAARMALARRSIAALLVMISMTPTGSLAWAGGDRDAGWSLARTWCSGCHIVDTSGEGTDAAPSFQSIAHDRSKDQTWLRAWLVAPHPQMPDLNLSRDEIDDIIAYLSSLEKP